MNTKNGRVTAPNPNREAQQVKYRGAGEAGPDTPHQLSTALPRVAGEHAAAKQGCSARPQEIRPQPTTAKTT